MRQISQEQTQYHEERRPSEDASSVGRWIIGTTVLSSFLGFAIGIGLGGAAGVPFWRAFSQGLLFAGIVGFCTMALRIATYDKKPYVVIREKTTMPIAFDDEPEREEIRGNAAPSRTPSRTIKHEVEHRGGKYEFSPTQLRLMLDRIESDNYVIARDYLGIETTMYDTVCRIMDGLGHWLVKRRNGAITSVTWTEAGMDWLDTRMRITPPTG